MDKDRWFQMKFYQQIFSAGLTHRQKKMPPLAGVLILVLVESGCVGWIGLGRVGFGCVGLVSGGWGGLGCICFVCVGLIRELISVGVSLCVCLFRWGHFV